MELRVLGPMEIAAPGRRWTIPGTRTRTILALLAAHPLQVVPVEDLIEAVWDGQPPPTARSQIQICVSQLRRVLGDAGRVDALKPGWADTSCNWHPPNWTPVGSNASSKRAGRWAGKTAAGRRSTRCG